MKNLIYPLLAMPIIALMSFKTLNDKNPTKKNTAKDPIVGTWNWHLENGEEVNEFDAKSSITFEKDGTFFNEKYHYSKKTGESYNKIYDTNNTWKLLKNNSYRLVDPENNPKEHEDYNIKFLDNNQKMKMTLKYSADENGDGIKENHTETLVLRKKTYKKRNQTNESLVMKD